jgi:hypothetical protein
VGAEFDWIRSSARLVFVGTTPDADEPLAITAIGVRRASLGGAGPNRLSTTVVKVWEPEPTKDGFQILTLDTENGSDQVLLVAEKFEITA